MNAQEAKVALLAYCRFARQYHYVCTEAPMPASSMADVVASDGTKLIEYEIKISMSDLRGDKKKQKHYIYNDTPIVWEGTKGSKLDMVFEVKQPECSWKTGAWAYYIDDNQYYGNLYDSEQAAKDALEAQYGSKAGVPNMLYYVIPSDMWANSKDKVIDAISDKYGIITFENHNYHGLIVQRKAKKLHNNKVTDRKLREIVGRMSSEIAALTGMYYNQNKHITEFGKQVLQTMNLKEEIEDEPL